MRGDGGPSDDELAEGLRDLGRRMDRDPAAAAEQMARISAAVAEAGDRPASSASNRTAQPIVPALLAAAAVLVLVAVVLVAPAREAVASWLGIGAVRISSTDDLPPETVTSTTTAGASGEAQEVLPAEVALLASSLPFDVLLPGSASAGPLRAASADASGAMDLIELRYDDFTIVQVASQSAAAAAMEKLIGAGTTITPVTVGGRAGLWLDGDPHSVAFVGPDGRVVHDTVRRAGNVLLWSVGDVTFRIEGLSALEDALAMAASLR